MTFYEEMREFVLRHGAINNPNLDRFKTGNVTDQEFHEFAVEFYNFARFFPRILAAQLVNTEDEQVADEFLAFLGAAAFVAHNARFDWRFVNAELLRARGGRLTNARLCTIRLARRLLPHVRHRNLDALAWLFGVTVEGRHRALPDARATARILLALLDVAEESGVADEVHLATLGGVGGTLWPARPY